MSHPTGFRGVTLLIFAATLVLGTSCNPTTTPGTPRTITIQSTLDLNSRDRYARTYALFLGGTTDSFGLQLTMSGLSSGTSVTVSSAVGDQNQTFTANGTVNTRTITGNVALVTVTSTAFVPGPTVTIDSATVTGSSNPPRVLGTLNNRVSALPLIPGSSVASPNTPIELPFDNTQRFYHFSASGLSNRPVDIVLDGPGIVLISDPASGFAVDRDGAFDLVDASTGNMRTFTPDASKDTLLFTVILQQPTTSAPSTGLARFSVNQPTDLISLTVRFADSLANYTDTGVPRPPGAPVSPFPLRAAMASTLAPFVNRASQALYQATEGRVRISGLTVITSLEAALGTRADVQVFPRTFPLPFRNHTNPLENIALDLDWLANGTTVSGDAGWVLAHEIMHHRYRLLDEYRDAMPLGLDPTGPLLCPNSIMAVFGGVELCWPGNHNPTGDVMLSAPPRNNVSAWAGVVPRLRATVPTVSPTRVLRTGSNRVTFPLTTSTVN